MSLHGGAAAAAVLAALVAGCGADGGTRAAETAPETEAQSEHCVDRATFKGDEPEDADPSWSPDGRRIAFHSTRNGDWEIWTIDVETCAVKRLTRGESPDWSPDGRRLVFTRYEPGSATHGVWTSNSGGGDVQPVTERFADSFPAWSPSGDLIAFDRNTVDEVKGQDWRELHLVQPDGTGLRKLTERGWHITPAFSSDGAWIAWAHGNSAIWRMRSDGTAAEAVTDGTENGDTDPSWSPDGKSIAYTHSTATIGIQPWLVELESNDARPLVSGPGSGPDWSPDGKWIVFARYDNEGTFLSLVRSDGTGLRELTAPAQR